MTGAGASSILCDSIDIEVLEKGSVIFANPLAAGDTVECTGTYTLMSDDVENLRRESVVTVEAKDEDGYHVGKSVTKTVPLNQASENTRLIIALSVTTGHACTRLSPALSKCGDPRYQVCFKRCCQCCLICLRLDNALMRRLEHILDICCFLESKRVHI